MSKVVLRRLDQLAEVQRLRSEAEEPNLYVYIIRIAIIQAAMFEWAAIGGDTPNRSCEVQGKM